MGASPGRGRHSARKTRKRKGAFRKMERGKRVVLKVGTSSLTYESGRPNLHRIEHLCRVLCDLLNAGFECVLVSSGAMGVGRGKLGISKNPDDVPARQAIAAVGQCELMFLYDKFCGEYGRTVAQVLLTRDVTENPVTKANTENTFGALLSMGILPVVNENDSVATEELAGKKFGDNDTLSAIVALLVGADLLVILTDTNGLYDKNPREYPDAKRIARVDAVTPQICALAGPAGSARGTGGMATKVQAAAHVTQAGIPCVVMSGEDPETVWALLHGEAHGTYFAAQT